MTDIDFEQCPACNADQINTEISVAGGVCGECGYVIRSDSEDEPPSVDEGAVDLDSGSSVDWQKQLAVHDSSDENLIELVEKTDEIGQALLVDEGGRTRGVEHAVNAWVERFTHGRSLCVVASASIDLATRELEKTRPSSVIADVSDVDVSYLTRTRQDLAAQLGVDLPVPHPVDYIPFICRSAGLPHLTKEAEQRLRSKESIPSGDPAGVAGAVVYLTLESRSESLSYKELGDIVGVTKETVWKHADQLRG